MHILIIAYACEPNRGSEAGTAWNLVQKLANFHRISVITRANNRDVIDKETDNSIGNHTAQFHYVDPSSWVIWLKRKKLIPVQLFYVFWQFAVSQYLKRNKIDHDIIHQLTFNSFEMPPYTFIKSDGIKIWGPIGGGQHTPRSMLCAYSTVERVKEVLRSLRLWASTHNPLTRAVLSSCHKVLFANKETHELLHRYIHGEAIRMIDVGVDTSKFATTKSDEKSTVTTFLTAGELVARKGTILAIEAFKRLSDLNKDFRLIIIGDGPERYRIEKKINEHNLKHLISLRGKVSHQEMMHEIEKADIFIFPSLRDTSGTVVLEAMSMGLPVICFDHQGAKEMIDSNSGVRVPITNYHETIENLSSAMKLLAENHELRIRCGEFARKSSLEYDWDRKAKFLSKLYSSVGSNAELK